MGVRMALGARRTTIVWLVLREALLLVAFGIVIGIPAALVIARLVSAQIAGLLFGVKITDASTIAVATGVLICVAVVAAYLPARRASLVSPLTALRSE